jgi:hypothetical protein
LLELFVSYFEGLGNGNDIGEHIVRPRDRLLPNFTS